MGAVNSATNSLNSAQIENQKFMDSIQGKLNQFGSEFQKLSSNIVNSDFLKVLIDIGRYLLMGANNSVILGISLTALAGIIGAKMIFSIDLLGGYITTKLIKNLGMATASAASFGGALSLMIPVAVLLAGIACINFLSKANERLIETKQKIIDTSNENIQKNEQEIASLTSLQKALKDARNNKESLLAISNSLNAAIGETPGLLEGEGKAYDIASQKIRDRIVELNRLIKTEKDNKVSAQRGIYNSQTTKWSDTMWDNTNGILGLDKVGFTIDKKEAVKALKEIDDYRRELIKKGRSEDSLAIVNLDKVSSKLKSYLHSLADTAKSVFQDFVNQTFTDTTSRTNFNTFIENLVFQGLSLDEISQKIDEAIPEFQKLNDLKNNLAKAKVEGTPTDEIIDKFIDRIGVMKVLFPGMSEYFNEFSDSFVQIASNADNADEAITDYTEVSAKAKESIDDFVKSADTLNAAFKEQSENGSLSAKTIMSVMEAGYGAALQIDAETGKVKLNATAYRDLTKAMLETEIVKLKLAKAGLEEGKSKGNPYTWISGINNLSEDDRKSLSDIEAQIAVYEEINKNIDEIIAGTYGDNGSDKSSSESSTGDPYKDMVEGKIKELQYKRDMDLITESEYYDSLEARINEHYKNKTDYLDDFQKYEVEIYKGRKQLEDSAAQEAEKRAEEAKKIAEDRIKIDQDAIDHRIQYASESYEKHKDENKLVSELESILKLVNISEEQRLKILKQISEIRKTEYSEILSDYENENFLLEKKSGTELKQIENYRSMQTVVHDEADKLREQGFSESSEEIQSLIRLWWTYEDEITGILEGLNDKITSDLKESLQSQSDLLQEHIDGLQEEQENLEGSLTYINDLIDKQISSLEDEKTALQENNSAIDRQIELTKLQDALVNARRNKNVRAYYADKGWVFEADQQKVAEAETNLSEWYRAENLRKEIENIDSRISAWQDYKNQWSDVAKNVDIENSKILATQLMGEGIESDILNRRASAVEEFGSRYKAVLADIKTAQSELTAVQEQISSVENTGSSSAMGVGGSKPLPISYDSSIDYQGEINTILLKMASATPEERKSSAFATYMEELGALESRRNSKIKLEGLPYEQTSLYGGTKFANGTDSVPTTGISIVGEFGEELRVLNAGDSILKANITKELKSFGMNPLGYLANKYNQLPQNILNKSEHMKQFVFNLNGITLPNVKNGQDFITELQLFANTHE